MCDKFHTELLLSCSSMINFNKHTASKQVRKTHIQIARKKRKNNNRSANENPWLRIYVTRLV